MNELPPLPENSQYDAGDQDAQWSPERSDDNFKVVIRIRPPLPRETRGLRPYQCTTHVENSGTERGILTLSENLQATLNSGGTPTGPDGLLFATYRFTFDHVYDQESTQETVYRNSAQHVVLSILQGYNAAIIAYGQTGTGKTHTMEGNLQGILRGIIPRTVEDIFTYIVNDPEPSSKYLVRASYLQIYNEVISDMLKPERTNLTIREDRRRGVFVEGLSEWVVRSPGEVYLLMQRGQAMRATGATKLNDVSSRSHAVCIIIVEKCTSAVPDDQLAAVAASTPRGVDATYNIKVGKLNLVDLAGSERVHVTGAVGKRLEESKKINASLSALGNVIAALTTRGERSHIPYRDSKLTRILEDSLGGNCRTTMICTIAPAMDAFQESLSTLKFANRAKNIKNEAHVNEDLDQRTLLRKYERELRRLKAELQRRSRDLVDKRALLEVEEQKKQAEADKLAALTALERRSREFLREKEEKRQLEIKIHAMQSQMLVGGAKLEDVPAFRAILAREHRRIRDEYETRLRDLEQERQAVDEDRQQVDRYKQLLLKQRDIMIALTARLNERDDQINMLQEELEAYDKYQRQLEDALDGKTAELIALRRAALEHAQGSPVKSAPLQSALGAWGAPGSSAHGAGDTVRVNDSGSGDIDAVSARLAAMGVGGGTTPGNSDVLQAHRPVRLTCEVSAADMHHLGGGGGDSYGADGGGPFSDEALEREAAMLQLRAENLRLVGQLSAATAALQAAADEGSWRPAEQQRVGVLTAACVAAQKERSALQQILESKVRRGMGDMVRDLGAGMPQAETLQRLQAMEQVLLKVGDAIRLAPPILPGEDEGMDEDEDEEDEGSEEESVDGGGGAGMGGYHGGGHPHSHRVAGLLDLVA
ncbi:hypothetical protein FOA52_013567 [Chlamydomonas sp. UWO 241]|nr:hypothetical protein FOA52_013567 [Chlamydomonas sp. UWO 241]